MNSSQTVRDFFQREVDSTRSLKHSGIVNIYDSGEEDGRPYYIMDLLDGVSLGTLLDSLKTLEIGVACRIARSVAKIAQEIHVKGFFRLDVKPNNIFLTRTGEVKLLDLGILTGADAASIEPESENRTIGTIGYMAPEQIVSPRSIDLRIDIYSIGMVLYECLVGELPFPLDDPLSWAGLAKEAPLLTTRIQAPADLAVVVSRMVAREPKNRYSSMGEVESDLRVFAASNAESMIHMIEACKSTRVTSRQATVIGLPPEMPVEVSFSAPSTWVPPNAPSGNPTLVGAAASRSPVRVQSPPAASAPPTPTAQETRPKADPSAQSPSQGDAEAHELLELRSTNRIKQEAALNHLSSLTGMPQLLFDFLTSICIWCGPGAVARSISMDRPNLILARNASQVDFPFEDPTISRQHVVFHLSTTTEGKKLIYAEDLSSASGTTVNRISLDFESLGMKSW
jgi:serine/threonine protein kinase